MRYPEGPAHGFVVVTDAGGTTIAHGESTQWLDRRAIMNRLVIHFDDGSLYDEIVRFSQNPVFRLLSYHLVQRGPLFTTSTDLQFDQTGKYHVRQRSGPDKDEEEKSGKFDVPVDAYNGLIGTLLKNLKPGASATAHTVAFTPEPHVLELHLTPEGSDRFWIGRTGEAATRFLIELKVTGVAGVVAKAVGKDPPPVRMWIVPGQAPTFLRFEGPLYADGPSWRVELTAPRWRQ